MMGDKSLIASYEEGGSTNRPVHEAIMVHIRHGTQSLRIHESTAQVPKYHIDKQQQSEKGTTGGVPISRDDYNLIFIVGKELYSFLTLTHFPACVHTESQNSARMDREMSRN